MSSGEVGPLGGGGREVADGGGGCGASGGGGLGVVLFDAWFRHQLWFLRFRPLLYPLVGVEMISKTFNIDVSGSVLYWFIIE
jgi:hypothetical protein